MTLEGTRSAAQEEFVNHGKTSKVERYKWKLKDKDKPGVYLEIPKHELNVDPVYQRTKTETKVLRIAQNFSWIAFGALSVGDRDNKYFIIDGQHRHDAAKRREDIKDLPCIVFETVSVIEEARGFLSTNTERKAVSGQEKFRALLATKDPSAVMVYRLCMDHGLEISQSKGRVGVVSCVTTLLHHARETPFALQKLWPLLMDLTAEFPLQKILVDGLMYIENRMLNAESLTDRKWRERVKRLGASALIKAADKALSFYSKPGHRVIAIGMVQAINHGCRNRLVMKGMEKEGDG